MIPGWVGKYVGLPFASRGRGPSYDCWGLVKHVLADHFGIEAPDFGGYYLGDGDTVGIPEAFGVGKQTWVRVPEGQEGDVVIITIGGKPMHCGVVVSPRCMLHARPVAGSCLENYDRPQWSRRIEGVYRHPSRVRS